MSSRSETVTVAAPRADRNRNGFPSDAEPVHQPAPILTMLVKRFPRWSETFILNEFLELRRQGIPVRLVAAMDPNEPWTQPEAEILRAEVRYLRTGRWVAFVPTAVRVVRRHPL